MGVDVDGAAHGEHEASGGGDGEVGIAEVDAGFLDEGFRAPTLAVGGGEDADFAVILFEVAAGDVADSFAAGGEPAAVEADEVAEGAVGGFGPDAFDGEEAGRGGGERGEQREAEEETEGPHEGSVWPRGASVNDSCPLGAGWFG